MMAHLKRTYGYHFLLIITTGYLFFSLTGCNTPSTEEEKPAVSARPNILLIMADDMGYSDIGCYGGEIDTPHLDRLAQNGIRYTRFYNGARCCPTRASLLTGLYAHQTGLGGMISGDRGVPGYRGEIGNNCVTIAEVLKEAGYQTYMSGKWHVSRNRKPDEEKYNWPCQRGFDRFWGIINGAGSYYHPNTLTHNNENIEDYPLENEDFYFTDAISDNAVKHISDHYARTPDKPFFEYVSYTAPHWPLHAKPEDVAKYKGRFDEGWDVLRQKRLQRLVEMGLVRPGTELSPRDSDVPLWQDAENKDWLLRGMEVYAAQVDSMDQGIGRIVKALEEHDQLDNTVIFFLSDNGGCAEVLLGEGWKNYVSTYVGRKKSRDGRDVVFLNLPEVMPGPEDTYQSYGVGWANLSNTPFRLYKHYVHEGGIASPLIVHWPAHIRQGGHLRHQIGHIIDIMATFIDLAAAEYPSTYNGHTITPMAGTSFVSTFTENTSQLRQLFWEHEGNCAYRDGNWKLAYRTEIKEWELYHLEKDPTELNNLADTYPDRVQTMVDTWEQWAERTHVYPRNKTTDK